MRSPTTSNKISGQGQSATVTFAPSFYTSLLNYSGQNKISGGGSAISSRIDFHTIKNIDGKFYIAAMGRVDKNRDTYLFKYNPTTNQIEQEFRIEMGVVTNDVHRTPVIDVFADGTIIVAIEDLDHIQTHGTPIHIYKTTTPFDLSTLTEVSVINARFTNPMIWVNGTNVFLGARGINNTVDFIRGDWWYYTSSNSAATWSAGTKVYDSGNEDLVAYIFKIYDYAGQEWFVLNERDNVAACWTFVAVIKRISGNTFGNADGSFTKDVSVSGAITRAEILSNFMVYQGNGTSENVYLQGGVVKTTGGIRLVVVIGTDSGQSFNLSPLANVDEVRFYTFNSGWSYNSFELDFDQLFTLPQVYYVNNNQTGRDQIVVLDWNGNGDAFLLYSEDNFITHTTTKIMQGHFKRRCLVAGDAFNVENLEDQLLVFAEHPGNLWEIVNEEPSDYSNIVAIRPPALPVIIPTVTSGTVESATSSRLDLVFNRAVNITTAGWTVTASGGAVTVSSVASGSGTNTPKFNLSRAIAGGETITFSYDPGTGATVATLDSTEVNTITNQAVTNNVVTIHLQDNFTGTTIDTAKWDVTNPNVSDLAITQNNKLLFTAVGAVAVASSLTNFVRSDNTYGRGVYAVLMNRETGFTNSTIVFMYRVDTNNDIAFLQTGTSGLLVGRVRSNGVTTYTSPTIAIGRLRIIFYANGNIEFQRHNGSAWAIVGVLQVAANHATLASSSSGNIQLSTNRAAADPAGNAASFDDVYVTSGPYTGVTP